MNTLDLTLQRKTEGGYPVAASLTRPGGFLPLRREGMLILDPVALEELEHDPLDYGTALGQVLFVDEIRDTFREGLSGGEPLRVLLSIEAPDLRALDWHRLAAPIDGGRWRFLASQQNTPFSLSISSPASVHFPAIGRRDLRALVLVAGPEALSGDYKLAPFGVEATTASIQEALGDIPCDVLPNPSLDTLCTALTSTPYTILHLVCHGAVNQDGETILYFPKDEKRGPTPATEVLNRLSSLAHLPHFAFIAACESALPQNGLGSLAGRLVRELGLPAVLAMTDRVSIATASAIAAPFYKKLYEHGQPDLALAQSLAGLQGAHDLTVPAIFSRLGERPLFDDNSECALSDNELEFGLAKLAESLPERAPVMDSLRDTLTRRLRSTLGADSKSLSESRRTERKETLDQLNSLSLEALDLSFNALCLGQTPPAYDSRSPFRGLESFRSEDAEYFFGRETLTRKLVQKLNEHNFLALLGASGSGKSSLVMAGLIPALNVPYAVFRPGAEPLSELEKALQAVPQLLVVDQFEELFTLSAREQRSDFISRL
ncbi:MAG: CHAT domain-containing protein, partial [Anaerolineae bacterium]|nr:CHAT domain-containing protein [Anaerolineae bacterium]